MSPLLLLVAVRPEQLMPTFHFRIGAKLAISAVSGVLLVIAMVGNQARVNHLARSLANEVETSETLQKNALSAEIALQQLILIDLDIRLTLIPQAIENILEDLWHRTADGNKAYDVALGAATVIQDRQNLATAKEAFNAYAATSREVASLQREIINLRDQQITEGIEWEKKFQQVLNNGAILTAGNRFSFLTAIKNADSLFKQARLESWSRFIRSDDGEIARLNAELDEAMQLLKASRQMTTDRAAIDVIDQLLVFPVQYKAIVDKLTAATDGQITLRHERADPLRMKAADNLAEVKGSVSKRVDRLAALSLDETARAEWINLSAGGFVILVLVGSAVFSSLAIGRPIQHIGKVLTQLAGGNKAVQIPYAARGDEVGDAARAAQTFKEYLLRMDQLEAEHKLAEARAVAGRKAEMDKFADEFQAAIGTIVDTVSSATTHLETTAAALTHTAETTHQLSGVVANAAEETSSNVESIATASDELATSVAEMGLQVLHSSNISADAVRQAERTDAQVSQLSHAAQHISEVLKLITNIAKQTNLLALNATIEAARAGESGRGFSVVASEVKTLASQTAQAADEIGGQIADMQTATNASVSAIKEIGATIRRVSEIATAIASTVEEQGASTQEIARNIHRAAQGTTQVVTNIHDVNRGASETGAASAEVISSAKALADQGKNLKREADKFLAKVRTG
jgi:methyl-accepting chemotaxis protein